MNSRIVPVILAGGQGTRLWPMSRSARPKQFLPLLGPQSPFQETLHRVADPERCAPPIVITNADYRFLVAEQAQETGVALSGVLLEPVARSTLPAIIAAAAFAARQFGDDAVLFVLPSDHAVGVDGSYWSAIETAASAARVGRLVTFGIEPRSPETGYGCIEAGAAGTGVRMVKRFVEKPDVARVKEMLEHGGYYWNSGMFMLAAGTFLAECESLAPDALAAARGAVDAATTDLDFIRLDAESFGKAPSISIDYGIFEKTSLASVIPVSFAWSDLGSWDAVWQVSAKDASENVAVGETTLSNTSRSLVVSDKAHIAVEGLDDVAIIASEDAVYVGRLSEAQRVGAMVKVLKADQRTLPLTTTHRTSYRPWGGFTSILSGDRFQVKRLFVKPGKRLSLQKHHHRSEHWVVVRGVAEVTIGDETQTIGENASVYIPLGKLHRLANPGKILLELIEVQTGSYLGEDDIIRVDDEFGRS
jgi:mannose-1-phosphate guanylyltransferase